VLGFPHSEALAQSGGGVAWQFPGTSCTVTAMSGSGAVIMMGGPTYTAGKVTPGAEVQGCIYQAYSQLDGGPGGALGYPTTDEQPMSTGRVSYAWVNRRPERRSGLALLVSSLRGAGLRGRWLAGQLAGW
jgi:hypothetical protein